MKSSPRPLKFLPPWRGDETLYSWAAAFHTVLGNGSARDTGSTLFAAEHACRDKVAPKGIDEFVRVTDGALGDLESVVRRRCSIGQFIPFLPPGRFESMLQQRKHADFGGWGVQLSMPASKLSSSTRLHSCASCVSSDLREFGLPRWRLPHQLSGSWMCLEHDCMLAVEASGASHWLLPKADQGPTLHCPSSASEASALRRLAGLSEIAFQAPQLNVEVMRQSIINGLRERGVVSWSRKLAHSALAAWFVAAPISRWLRELKTPESSLSSGEWIHDLLGRRREGHPLKWLLLWTTAFDDEDQAASHRRFVDPLAAPCWDVDGQGNLWDPSSTNLPVGTNQMVIDAPTLADVANSMGIAPETLRKRIGRLGSDGGAFRSVHRRPEKASAAVQAIQEFIEKNPGCTRSEVHRKCKAAVEWIRLNSPETYAVATLPLENRTAGQQWLPFD